MGLNEKEGSIYCLTTGRMDSEAYLLKSYLNNEGLKLFIFSDINAALSALRKQQPVLMVFDGRHDGGGWIDKLKLLREETSALILMLMESGEVMPRITALSLGADICLEGDTLPVELVAYIKAIVRRIYHGKKTDISDDLSFGNIRIAGADRSVYINGIKAGLTPNEFEFLLYMIKSGKAVSKEELLREVWKTEDKYLMTHVTEDLVKRLRKKLRRYDSNVSIEAVWGFGYRLSKTETEDEDKSAGTS